jgi:hypothetical protein
MVVEAPSQGVLGGPFAELSEAVAFATAQAALLGTPVLYQALDETGRATGDPVPLRVSPV